MTSERMEEEKQQKGGKGRRKDKNKNSTAPRIQFFRRTRTRLPLRGGSQERSDLWGLNWKKRPERSWFPPSRGRA